MGRSKWQLMAKSGGSAGLASIVIVSIIVTLLGLISVGFVRLVNQEQRKSLAAQQATTAFYGAQSAIEAAVAYLKQHPTVENDNCTGLLNNPIDPNLASGIKITCLNITNATEEVTYFNLEAYRSRVAKFSLGDVKDIEITWEQGSGETKHDNYPVSWNDPAEPDYSRPDVLRLPTEQAWNARGLAPMLRVTLYPIRDGALPAIGPTYEQDETRTYFFVPVGSNVKGRPSIPSFRYSDHFYRTFEPVGGGSPGAVTDRPVNAVCYNGWGDSGQAKYACRANLTEIPAQYNSHVVRITPIYGTANVTIGLENHAGQTVPLPDNQAIIDVTVKSGSASKRLKAAVDINRPDGPVIKYNLPAEYALRSAGTICKSLDWQPPGSGINSIGPAKNFPYCWSYL